MKCQDCRAPMAQTLDPRTMETAHRCPGCGRSVVTRDAGVYQAPPPRQQNPERFRALPTDEQTMGLGV